MSKQLSLTKQLVAILEARGATDMEKQLRYSDKQLVLNRLRLAKDLVRVGRLAKMSDEEIVARVKSRNPL